MKYNKFFLALMAVALPLSFVACGSDDKDEEAPYEFPVPVNQDKAAKYTFSSQQTPIKSVSFGEGTTAIIEQTSADGTVEYVVGTYTEEGGVYTVSSGGQTWKFTVSNGTNSVEVTITTNGETVTITASKSTPSANRPDFIGDWKPFMTTLNLHKQGTKGTVTDELKGIDFQALKARAEKENCHIKEDFSEGYVVEKVTFQGVGEFGVLFTSGKNYKAEWRFASSAAAGDLKFEWQNEDAKSNQFLNEGNAHIQVYKIGVYKGECWLSLKSTIEQDNGEKWDVEVIFRLIR